MTRNKGFTLIELLIVVAIIAILAAIAVPNFLEAQTRSKVSRAMADMRSLATAIEAYRTDGNIYPPMVRRTGVLNGPSVFYGGTNGVSDRFTRLTTPISYITSVFRDPFINPQVKFALSADTGGAIPEYDTYDYTESRSLTAAGTIAGWNTQDRAGCLTSGAGWLLVSAGPDLVNAFGGGQSNYTAAVRSKGVDYDPTNGSVSAGDVVRLGGGPATHYGGGGLTPTIDRVQGKYLAVP